MSEKFSATLRIGDLSDFIAPSQACIVSLKGLKANPTKPDKPEVFFFFFNWFRIRVLISKKYSYWRVLNWIRNYYFFISSLVWLYFWNFWFKVSISNKQLQSEPVKISLKDCLACRYFHFYHRPFSFCLIVFLCSEIFIEVLIKLCMKNYN